MQRSILLCMNGLLQGNSTIGVGVGLARRWGARLRCVTLMDTRRLASVSSTSDAAIYTTSEVTALLLREQKFDAVKAKLSAACVEASIDFDMRSLRGDPYRILPAEAIFHDLIVTILSARPDGTVDEDSTTLTPQDLVKLVGLGVQPLLVLRESSPAPQRVLLINDGSPGSIKAIRVFGQQDFFPDAAVRLLSVVKKNQSNGKIHQEIQDYCQAMFPDLETGVLHGSVRQALLPYAEKWEADLIVAGASSGQVGLQRLLGSPLRNVLEKSTMSLFVANA